MLGVAPAQQRFEADEFAGRGFHLRLVVHLEFASFQRAAQAVFEVESGRHIGGKAALVELVVVPPLLLGVVHGGVGMLDEQVGLVAVFGVDGDAD